MSRDYIINVPLTDADEKALAGLPAAHQTAFIVAKLAARVAAALMVALQGDILSKLSPVDQKAVGSLIAAVAASAGAAPAAAVKVAKV